MICLSMVTYNRADVLARTLQAIFDTCREDEYRLLVSDNASIDGTRELLDRLEAEGKLKAWHLAENLGTCGGRNAHWAECIGHDSIRMDDKVLPLVPGWLRTLKRQSEERHALVAIPYDATVQFLWNVAPPIDYVQWHVDQGRGGPLIYIPAGVIEQLGGVDELHPDIRYGWDDCLFIERALLLGWNFGFSLRVPVEFLAGASPERRASAMQYHPLYVERMRQYKDTKLPRLTRMTTTRPLVELPEDC